MQRPFVLIVIFLTSAACEPVPEVADETSAALVGDVRSLVSACRSEWGLNLFLLAYGMGFWLRQAFGAGWQSIKYLRETNMIKTAMQVNDVMSRDVTTVGPDEALINLSALLRRGRFHHLLVTERDRLVGVISDRDVLRATSPFLDTHSESWRDASTLTRAAQEIMTREVVTVQASTPVEEAARLMLERGVSCLPVVDDRGRARGIVTSKDVLKYVSGLRTLSGPSAPPSPV